MDLNEIKSIIEIDGGKFIIVENDKPSLVVISFEDYKKHLQIEKEEQSQSLFQDTQVAGKDSDEEKVEEKSKEKKDDELTIDDLPL